MFFRDKPAGSYRYLQIVHSVREGKKVRQRVIATLGRMDLLEASGRFERLMRSGLRHSENLAVIDAHATGEIQPVAIRRIGPDLVFGRLWKESGIPEVLRSVLKARRYEFRVERAIYLTVLHRLFASGSDRAAERWREDYLIPGTEELNLHHTQYPAMIVPLGPLHGTANVRGPRRLRLHEKGGKEHEMPVHHLLEEILNEYIVAAGLQSGQPLFQSVNSLRTAVTGRVVLRLG